MQTSTWTESDDATNAIVSITKAAEPGRTHKLLGLQATYSLGSTNQQVTVTINAVNVFQGTVSGFLISTWFSGLTDGVAGEALVVTLASGGPLNIGSLTINGSTT